MPRLLPSASTARTIAAASGRRSRSPTNDWSTLTLSKVTRRRFISEDLPDGLREVARLELGGGHVDGDARLDRPAQRVAARPSQDPFSEAHDDAGLFRQRNEVRRRDESLDGMPPAHQGLETDDLAGQD